MGISKYKTGGYRVDLQITHKSQKHRFTKVLDTKAEAKEYEAKCRTKIKSGSIKADQHFNIYGQNYIDNIVGLESTTIESYQYAFNRIKDLIKTPLEDITNTEIVNVFNKLKLKRFSPRSLMHSFRILKMITEQAQLDFKINIPVGTFHKTVREKLNEMDEAKALSLEEQRLLIGSLKANKDKDLISYQVYIYSLIGIYTGMRKGEISALTWNDIDLDEGLITVRHSMTRSGKDIVMKEPKTKAGIRDITIDKDVVNELKEFKAYLTKIYGVTIHNTAWIFMKGNGADNTPLTSWSHRISSAMNKLDIKHTSHSLRHTHASNLLMNNCPLVQVAKRLGHADPSITLRVYSHFLEELKVDFEQYIPKIVS